MSADTVVPVDGSNAEVMASVEVSADARTLVIADITCDGAWLTMDESEAPSLDSWR